MRDKKKKTLNVVKKYWKQEVDRNTTKGSVNIEFYPKTAVASGQQMAKC